jgi:hypothetical protein
VKCCTTPTSVLRHERPGPAHPRGDVARLPVYLRCLVELADDRVPTISSERLAELAGVNAAKVRKDLSYLGSYGTRGVGYDVEYLMFQMSRELGLTQDWPVVIAGVGNLGQALANYGGFTDRGFPVGALVDVDPTKVGTSVAGVTVHHIDDLPSWSSPRASPSASSPRPASLPPRAWPSAWSRRGSVRSSTSRRACSASTRRSRCARSIWPSSCRSSASTVVAPMGLAPWAPTRCRSPTMIVFDRRPRRVVLRSHVRDGQHPTGDCTVVAECW